MKKDYSKLGGWMILFIIANVSSVFMAITSYSQNEDALGVLAMMGTEFSAIALLTKVSLFCVITGTIVGIIAVVIRKRKVLNVFFALVALSAIGALVGIFMYPSYLENSVAAYRGGVIIVCVRDIVELAIWFRYFKVSSRAKVYFGEVEQPVISEVSDVITKEVE